MASKKLIVYVFVLQLTERLRITRLCITCGNKLGKIVIPPYLSQF